ncbi:MAG: adenylate/guanylate cyclase domain-containing protein [Spirochaetaceae bacterium]
MSIRVKIVLVVLPLLVVTLVLAGSASYFMASTGITRIAKDFLGFKASELEKYAAGQWLLLVQNDLTGQSEMVEATQAAVAGFAGGMVRSETELMFALGPSGDTAFSTQPFELSPGEGRALKELFTGERLELRTIELAGVQRVARGFYFEPYDWYVFVTETRDAFYSDVDRITTQTIYIVVGASLVSVLLLLVFANRLIRPLSRVADTMRTIITSNDLSSRVPVEFKDETGTLAHTFNLMVGELDKAYSQVKNYALRAVIAQKKEAKIRQIFQKYVPQELIDQFFENPEAMLVGDNRVLSILFSDIRSFSSISEGIMPDQLVQSLNAYFSVMVDIIMNRRGIVDKYIGDAIMAFFGAPVKREDDALQSVLAGIEMIKGVETFNRNQEAAGLPPFHTGVGINYGVVTVGNIGTDRKMDYTVIGDMVNLASRLEGLTKYYKQPLIISESLQAKVKDQVPCRLLDTVAVKGKKSGTRIYTAKDDLTAGEEELWKIHNRAMDLYYERNFSEAEQLLLRALSLAPKDSAAALILERCRIYAENPPGKEWNGIHIMDSK